MQKNGVVQSQSKSSLKVKKKERSDKILFILDQIISYFLDQNINEVLLNGVPVICRGSLCRRDRRTHTHGRVSDVWFAELYQCNTTN